MHYSRKEQLSLYAERLLFVAKLSFFLCVPLLLLMNYWSSLVIEELELSAQRRLELMEQRLEIIEMKVAKYSSAKSLEIAAVSEEVTEKKNLN